LSIYEENVCGDSVTRVNDSTRLESRFSQNDSTRFESQLMTRDSCQSHFYKISEFLIDKPTSCALKEMSIFASVMTKIGANFLCFACLVVLCYIIRIKRPNLHRGRPETSFTEESAGRNILTLCRGLMQYLIIVILAMDLIL